MRGAQARLWQLGQLMPTRLAQHMEAYSTLPVRATHICESSPNPWLCSRCRPSGTLPVRAAYTFMNTCV